MATPAVVGLSQERAQQVLAERGLTVGRVTPVFGERPVGEVVEQSPRGELRSRPGVASTWSSARACR